MSHTPLLYRVVRSIFTYYIYSIRALTPERISGFALLLLSYLIVSPYPNKGILSSDMFAHPVVIAGLLAWCICGGLYLIYKSGLSHILLFGVVILPYMILTTANLKIAVDEGRASIFAFMHFFFVFAFFGHRFITRIAIDIVKGYTDVVMDTTAVV